MRKSNLTSSSLVVLLFSSLVFLTACSSDGEERPEYLDALSTQSLEVPPKLTQPNTKGALQLPEPSEKAKATFSNGKSTAVEVKEIAPVFKGVRLKNESRLFWLEIDSPIENVWASLPHFLAAEGIMPTRTDKLLGIVETEWMDEYQLSYEGEESSWLQKFSPDFKDMFRLRLEKAGKNMTRMYVAHRGVQIIVADDGSEWVQRDSDAMLEREIMYRYMLYAGASKSTAKQLLSGYQSYQSRVIEDKQLAQFKVQGNESNIWKRLNQALDRLGVDVIKADKQSRKIEVQVGDLKVAKVTEAEQGSWFSGFFGRDIEVDEDEGYETSDYKKPPVKSGDRVKMTIQQLPGAYASEIKLLNEAELQGIALDFRNALVNQLK